MEKKEANLLDNEEKKTEVYNSFQVKKDDVDYVIKVRISALSPLVFTFVISLANAPGNLFARPIFEWST